MPTRAPQIPKHLWPQMVMACIASGLTAGAFGKNQGLTKEQCARLRLKVQSELKKTSAALTSGPENDSQAIIRLQAKLRAGMLGTAEVASRLLHRFNAEYAETVDPVTKAVTQPVPQKGTLTAWKWAWSVGANVLAITRRPANEVPADPAPPVREEMQNTPPHLIKRIRTVEVLASVQRADDGASVPAQSQ